MFEIILPNDEMTHAKLRQLKQQGTVSQGTQVQNTQGATIRVVAPSEDEAQMISRTFGANVKRIARIQNNESRKTGVDNAIEEVAKGNAADKALEELLRE